MSARSDLAAFSRKRLERLEASLTAALEAGDVEAVHQVRVSCRKLVEPIRIFGTFLGERSIRRVSKTLRRIRNQFCHVRDLDVLQMSFSQPGCEPNLSPTHMAQLEGSLTSRRERALNRARENCKSPSPEKVVKAIATLIDDFELAADRSDRRIVDDAQALWRERADELISETDPSRHRESLHPMRICLKRFRYSTELLLRLEGREDDEILRDLAALQDELGAWNDAVFAARKIARLARDPDTLAAQPRWAAALFGYAGERCLQMEARHDSIVARLPATHAFLQRVRESSLTIQTKPQAVLANTGI